MKYETQEVTLKRYGVVLLLLCGCNGASQPVQLATSSANANWTGTSTGSIPVPEDAYVETCAGEFQSGAALVVEPHPPDLAEDLAALDLATSTSIGQADMTIEITIGDFKPPETSTIGNGFATYTEKPLPNIIRASFVGSYDVLEEDTTVQAALLHIYRLTGAKAASLSDD